jgi:predicted DNA-binding transcriptional regulator YafY
MAVQRMVMGYKGRMTDMCWIAHKPHSFRSPGVITVQRYERLHTMADMINKGRCPSPEDFCRMFEVAKRTVFDDIRLLRERTGEDIVYDHFKGGYINRNPKQKLLEFELDTGELFALTLGKDMLAEYSGTTFEPILRRAIEKISDRLPERVKIDMNELRSIVHFKPVGMVSIPRQIFLDFNRACQTDKSIEMEYFAAHKGEITTRKIDPYRLVESRGAWYVVGYCHLRDELRMFALHRVSSHKLVNGPVEPKFTPEKIDAYVSSAFLLEKGEPEQQVTIRFNPVAARYVRERKWHASQKQSNNEDGGCTLSFTTCRLDEVKRWVLEYGANAEVLEPPALRDMMAQEFAQGSQLYKSCKSEVISSR